MMTSRSLVQTASRASTASFSISSCSISISMAQVPSVSISRTPRQPLDNFRGRPPRLSMRRGTVSHTAFNIVAAAGGPSSYVVMPRYFVLEDQPSYQIRLFDGHKAVRREFSLTEGDDKEELAQALATLHAYANGENDEGKAVKTREPVVVAYTPDGTGMVDVWVSEDPPVPSSSKLQVVEKPGQVLVAKLFAGDVDAAKEELLNALKEDQIGGRRNIDAKGAYELAYFGPLLDLDDTSKTELRMPIKLTLS